jgi:hypothetical protein
MIIINQRGTDIENKIKRKNHIKADLQACQAAGIKPKNHKIEVEIRLSITAIKIPIRS